MTSSPSFWVLVYLIQLLLLSLAMGSLTLHQPRLLMVPRLPRFLLGFCITPFVLGAWMLLLAAILPGAPRWLFLIPLPAVAIVPLALYGPRTLRRLIQDYQRTRRLSRESWPAYLIYIGAALILVLVIGKLFINGRPPLLAHDALFYLSEALPFAQERSVSAVNGFRGAPDGALRGDNHGFLFPAFLSHALITTGDNPLGYPHDHTARVAFQVTLVYMLLSVVALTATARYQGSSALALIFLLQVPQFEYISYQSSRDAFRIIPLMLLAVTLVGLSPQRLRLRLRPASLLPPLILAAFSLAGHTLGGFLVVTIALAWAIWGVLGKARWLNLFLILAAIGVGLLLSGNHYIRAYLETGSVMGDNVFNDNAIVGTPLWEERLKRDSTRLEEISNTTQRLAVLLSRDQYRLSVPGLLSAILAIILRARFRRERRAKPILLTSLITVATILPFTGLFDYTGIKLSEWFILNFRYQLSWYPFAAVCLALLVSYGYNEFMQRRNRHILGMAAASEHEIEIRTIGPRSRVRRTRINYVIDTDAVKVIASMAFVLLITVATYSAHKTIMAKWRPATWDEEFVSETIAPYQAAMEQMPAGQRLLLDDARYNYYLRDQAVVMYSRPTWPVIQARNEGEVRDALKALNIGAVALREVDIPGWWDLIAMFSFLSDPKTAFMADRGESLRVYIVDETLVGQYNLSVENMRSQALAYLEQSRAYLQQARAEESFAAYQEAEALYPAVIEELTEEEREMVAAARQALQSEESPTPRRGLKTSIVISKILRVLVWVELGLLVGVIVLALSLWITLERSQGGAASGTERKSG